MSLAPNSVENVPMNMCLKDAAHLKMLTCNIKEDGT